MDGSLLPDQEATILRQELDATPRPDEVWFLLSTAWFKEWKEYCEYDRKNYTGARPRPGPVDNSALLAEPFSEEEGEWEGKIKPGLHEGIHYTLVHKRVWTILMGWYGGGPPIARPVSIATNGYPRCRVEVYPVVLKLQLKGLPAPHGIETIEVSGANTMENLTRLLCEHLGIALEAAPLLKLHYRSGNVGLDEIRAGPMLVREARVTDDDAVHLLVDATAAVAYIGEEAKKTLPRGQPARGNPFKLGQGVAGAARKEVEEQSDRKYFSMHRVPSDDTTGADFALRKPQLPAPPPPKVDCPDEIIPPPLLMPIRALKGLRNLGQTDYMSSIVQILSHTKALVSNFVSGAYMAYRTMDDVERNQLADEYASVVRGLWSADTPWVDITSLHEAFSMRESRYSDVNSPHDAYMFFKVFVGRLHGSIVRRTRMQRRVSLGSVGSDTNKPMTMRDEAKEAWDWFLKNNQSIFAKSIYTLMVTKTHCITCGRFVSQFEPVTSISIPVAARVGIGYRPTIFWKTHVDISVVHIPQCIPKKRAPIKYTFTMKVDDTVLDLKEKLATNTETPVEKMILCEIFQSYLWKIYNDDGLAGDIDVQSDLYCYDTRYNWNSDNPHHQLVQVLHGKWNDKPQARGGKIDIFDIPVVEVIDVGTETPQLLLDAVYQKCQWHLRGEPNLVLYACDSEGTQTKDCVNSKLVARYIHTDDKIGTFAAIWNDHDYFYYYDRYLAETVTLDITFRPDPGDQSEGYIPYSDEAISLKKCLEKHFRSQTLEGEDAPFCNHCGRRRGATLTKNMWCPPEYLVIHLDRFIDGDRLDTLVTFPLENLQLSNYFRSPETTIVDGNATKYSLYAVCNHKGTLLSGHYSATIKHLDTGRWYMYDDQAVEAIDDEKSIINSSAYLLFYTRQGAAARVQWNKLKQLQRITTMLK